MPAKSKAQHAPGVSEIPEEKLLGWLVFLGFGFNADRTVYVPARIIKAMAARGWAYVNEEPDWDGERFSDLTVEGRKIYDLEAPAWGVETIPDVSENT